MQIRAMQPGDIPACAEILCSVCSNELSLCRWTPDTAAAYLTDITRMRRVEDKLHSCGLAGITLSTNRYASAAEFYRRNGFADCRYVLFMAKGIPADHR